jgi:hypothetical protein
MNSNNQMTQRYYEAIEKLKSLCKSEIAIKRTEFCTENKIQSNFFSILKKINAIEEIISSHKEGVIFNFIYKKAENENILFLADRVCYIVREYQQTKNLERNRSNKEQQQQNTIQRIKQQTEQAETTKIELTKLKIEQHTQTQQTTKIELTKQQAEQHTQTQQTTKIELTKQQAQQFLIDSTQSEIDKLNSIADNLRKEIELINENLIKKQSHLEMLKSI